MEKSTNDIKKICLMCMLTKKPMHGYDMMKGLEERLNKKVGPGFVYPLLNEMQKKGYLKVNIESTGKRKRKIYSLTSSGRKACMKEKECLKRILKEFF